MAIEQEIWSQQAWQTAYDSYQRPTDWLALPIVNVGEEKIVLLHAVYDNGSNFCAFNVTGSNGYTVNWGDGTSNNYATGVQANHLYDFNYAGFTGTTTTNGYKQAIITITPQVGGNLLTVNFSVRHASVVAAIQYTTQFLDCRMVGANFTAITFGGAAPAIDSIMLEMFEFVGPNNITAITNMFYNCQSLQKVVSLDTSKCTSIDSMFVNCYLLVTVPMFDFSVLTICTNVFFQCYSLYIMPFWNLSKVTNAANLHYNCSGLKLLPAYNLSVCTIGTFLCYGCTNLVNPPLFTFGALQDARGMFGSTGIIEPPLWDFSTITTGQQLFYFCKNLRKLPLYNFGNMINGQDMCSTCNSLETIPLFDLHSLQNGTNMFLSCYPVKTLPLFNLSALTNGSAMFNNLSSLLEIPLFNLSSLTNGNQMFFGCSSVLTVPLFNLSALTIGSNMFSGMNVLSSIPAFNLGNLQNGNNMFLNCFAVKSIGFTDLHSLTNGNGMFNGCYSLTSIPQFTLGVLNDGTNMFANMRSLTAIPALDFNSLVTTTTMFSNLSSNSKILATGLKNTFDIVNNKLSKPALELLFMNLASNVTAKTAVVTNNWGSDAVLSKANAGTATGSATVTLVDTTNLIVGMRVTGTGIDTARAVTFQDTGDTVTLASHNFPNGMILSFPTIVTTTGITVKTPYYVVNSTANTFQVALTNGGAPIALTTNGTGTVYYPTYITSINPAINFTIDRVASATGTVTLTMTLLDTSIAVMKGWTVTG